MNNNQTFVNLDVEKRVKTNYRWLICSLLFFATTINYMDRQVLIGLAGATHQSCSANIYSTIGVPKSTIATIIGFGSMAGGLSSALINKDSGLLFDYSENTNLFFGGFYGIEAGYFIIFSICGVSYLIGWIIMKLLVPKSKQVIIK